MKERFLEVINNDSIDMSELKTLFIWLNIQDIIEIFNELDTKKTIQIFRILPKAIATDLFAHIDSEQQRIIIEALNDTEVSEIMGKLFVDDAVDFIEEMPANVVHRVLRNVTPEKRAHINQILQYPEDSAGSIMTTEFVNLRENNTVKEAFEIIRNTGLNKETIYTCYVISWDRILLGVVSAKSLMLASPKETIKEIMITHPIFVHTTDDQEAVADLFQRYDFLAMPVVDKEERLVGIITVDDIVDVIIEEHTEDIEKMGALSPSDEPYLKTGIIRLARNRIVWLLILMLSATITGQIIISFEHSLAALPILMAFIPMLMDTAGNSGAQASTLIIRGMALGEIQLKNIFVVLWKEIRVGVLCGLALGLVNLVRVYIMNGRDFMLSLTITLSLFFTILMAKSVGCLLPQLARRLKIDPAIMAAPMITTIVDALALIVYFSMAKLIFGI